MTLSFSSEEIIKFGIFSKFLGEITCPIFSLMDISIGSKEISDEFGFLLWKED